MLIIPTKENPQKSVNAFNNYFPTVAGNIPSSDRISTDPLPQGKTNPQAAGPP
jgi:hypothetical protein